MSTEELQVIHRQIREILKPVKGISKLGDLRIGDAHRLHNLPLGLGGASLAPLRLVLAGGQNLSLLSRGRLGDEVLLGEDGRVTILSHLVADLLSAGGNGSASDVQAKGPKNLTALHAPETRSELGLRQRKPVSEMELPIHVGKGKCNQELWGLGPVRGSAGLESLSSLPLGLGLSLEVLEQIKASGRHN